MYRIQENENICFCPFLLPLIIFFNYLVYKTQTDELYSTIVRLASNTSLYFFNFYLYKEKIHTFHFKLFLCALQLYPTFNYNVFFVQIIHLYFLDQLMLKLPKIFPKSFTLCELSILCQCISFILLQSFLCFGSVAINNTPVCSNDTSTKLLQILCFGVFLIFVFAFLMAAHTSFTVTFREYLALFLGSIFIYSTMWKTIRQEPIKWILIYLTETEEKIILIKIWSCITIFCVSFLIIFSLISKTKATTINRKVFHLAMAGIFIAGAKIDINMFYFSSTIVIIIFIMLEKIRLINLYPFGNIIDKLFQSFTDEKDSGILIISNIYLLMGFCLPIWMAPKINKDLIFASGLITIGFGDTMASIVGSLFGKHQWDNSKKTYEGTLAAFLAQVLGGLLFFNYINTAITFSLLLKLIINSIFISLLEAKTSQVDNLILPLYFNLSALILNIII